MEKIRNLMNPGKSKDDEVMYGSGQSGDPVHTGSASQATSSDPIASSTHPTSTSTREAVGQGGTGSIQQGSAPFSSSRMPGMFDDDVGSTSSIKSGLPGNSQESNRTGISDTHDPLDTNKALPREPTTGGTGAYSSSSVAGSGPHSSTLTSKTDPRVDSDLDRSSGLGSQGTTGNASALTGSSLPDRTVGDTENTSGAGRSFPLGGTSSGTATSGPHTSNLTKKADPRADSDRDGSRGLGGSSGLGSGTGATVSSAHQGELSRSNVGGTSAPSTGQTLPRGYGEETWTHDHNKHGHDYIGDPCENEPPAPGAVHFTSGPHSLDTTNRLDPRVSGGDLEGTSSSITESSVPHSRQHHGRDVPLSAGVGTTGAGAYEASRDVPSSSTTQHGNSTAGPHKSDLLNKADPRVDSDLSKQRGATTMPDTTGVGSTSSTEPSISGDHHYGGNAALAGAGAGAAGAAVHGGQKHHDSHVPKGTSSSGYSNPYSPSSTGTGLTSGPTSSTTGTTSSTRQIPTETTNTTGPTTKGTGVPTGQSPSGVTAANGPATTSKDHDVGRNAGLAGVGAGAAYEADKHLHGSHGDSTRTRDPGLTSKQQPLSGKSAPEYGRETDLSDAGTTGIHDSRHQPSSTSGLADQPSTAYDDRDRAGESHRGRDAALGAGAGAAAVAGGEELSRKYLERQQKADYKEEMTEQEAAHKQELKEQKHHQHEQQKAEKAHEKAIAKEEKHHQHEKEKAEKAHEKAMAKEEAQHKHKEEPQGGEKKHHGLLGLFHRDKADKELKEDEIARKEHLEAESQPGAATTGTTGLSEREKHEHAKEHDRNRLHKDPPPGYGQTGYAEPPKEGYASQVTGGTGTTALAQGNPVSRGSHMTGLGNKADPSVAGRGDTIDSDRTRDDQGRVVEPHTGLPINTSKGDGAGGTDANPIPGYHPEQSGTHSTTGTASGASDQGQSFGHFQDHAR
ncbi:MAG: hypothetical protein LQ343_000880 [Gyalolechia ehrenbergii]|nr:MAG: hypothetical protein LQ343_000880 [Gyalolechia ehrenbergii]